MIVYNMIKIFIQPLILLLIYPCLVMHEKRNTKVHRKQFFLFLYISKLQEGQAIDFTTDHFSFFFHFQKFWYKMFGHQTLTGCSLNNPERHNEEAMVKCQHCVHQTVMKSGCFFNNQSGLHYLCFRSDSVNTVCDDIYLAKGLSKLQSPPQTINI